MHGEFEIFSVVVKYDMVRMNFFHARFEQNFQASGLGRVLHTQPILFLWGSLQWAVTSGYQHYVCSGRIYSRSNLINASATGWSSLLR